MDMPVGSERSRLQGARSQDFHAFLADYRTAYPDDVMVIGEDVSPDQEISGVVWSLAAQGRAPLLLFERVRNLSVKVATNVFGCRTRAARLLGTTAAGLHDAYQAHAR